MKSLVCHKNCIMFKAKDVEDIYVDHNENPDGYLMVANIDGNFTYLIVSILQFSCVN